MSETSETQNGKAAASDKVCHVIRVRRLREVHRRQIVNADGHVSRLLPRQMSEPQSRPPDPCHHRATVRDQDCGASSRACLLNPFTCHCSLQHQKSSSLLLLRIGEGQGWMIEAHYSDNILSWHAHSRT